MYQLTKIASLKTPEAFRQHTASLGIELPIDESLGLLFSAGVPEGDDVLCVRHG